jgi:hypothetical protein
MVRLDSMRVSALSSKSAHAACHLDVIFFDVEEEGTEWYEQWAKPNASLERYVAFSGLKLVGT